ncbi:MAG: hypothetical protein WC836_19335 [Desulfobacula sp.]|jgi:hypothetical protein
MHQNIISPSEIERIILEKIRMLPPDKIYEVDDFIDFISRKGRDSQLLQSAARMSENSFNKVWDNCEDDVYDRL